METIGSSGHLNAMVAVDKDREKEERRLVGRRIRRRRQFLNITQSTLALALGVTFQQIQKYEKGISRVSEKRLGEISKALDVSPSYFSDWRAEMGDDFEQFLQSSESTKLYRALSMISNAGVRARLILAIEAFCDGEMRPEDRETGMMLAWLARIARQKGSDRHHENAAAAIHTMKVELAQLIGRTLKARKSTQKFAAEILHTDQARVSTLARGKVKATSFEKLLRYLVLLGWDAHLTVTKQSIHRGGKVALSLQRDSSRAESRRPMLNRRNGRKMKLLLFH
jgi:transcriptional regulator with XRE-family HTH domain